MGDCGCGGKSFGFTGEIPYRENVRSEAVTVALPTVMALVVGVGSEPQELIGKATGKHYGHQRNGAVFPMDRDDFEAEKRVVRPTQDTLGIFL